MHAIEITETGGPEVLRYVETPSPPGAGQVLIKAEAIGVNYIDTYFRSGQNQRQLPFIIGQERVAPSPTSARASTVFTPAIGWSPQRCPAAMPNSPLRQHR